MFASLNRHSIVTRLMLGTALSGVMFAGAMAQNASSDVETVVSTGTSIRGVAPTGTNLITVDRAAIESTGAQTTQQLLSNTPQINTFGGSGQGGSNSDFSGGFAPAIHSIGGGSSSATLVLINGHRFPTQGLTEAQADPTAIPASALQRVEILPDGDSSIYGSDAVAGVINFITRRDFTGVEFGAQSGIADHYNTFTANALFGHSWGSGSVLAAADYTNQSNLMFGSRDFMTTRQDIRMGQADPALFTGISATPPTGAMTTTPAAGPGTTGPYGVTIPYPSRGVNFQDFLCPVATIAASSSASAFYYQPGGGYGGAGYSTSTANQPGQGACDRSSYASILPSTVRYNGLFQVRQAIGDDLAFDLEVVYSTRVTSAPQSRGTVQAQVFGPNAAAGNAGSTATTQAAFAAGEVNPFYVGNATTGNATEFVRYDFNQLLGPGASTKQLANNFFTTAGLSWDLGNNREITVSGTVGTNFNSQHVNGVVSQGEALLALNGTNNTNGTPATTAEQDIYGLGTTYPVQRVLTVNNALDVWNPVGSNRTSAAVINALKDGGSNSQANQGLQDIVAKFDGPVLSLPAGDLKIAVGGEFMHQTMDEYGTTVNVAGPALSNSNAYYYRNGRQVYSTFLEANIPLVDDEMGVPLMRTLELDISGRYDKYSDFGDTKNPKIAVDWVLFDGLKARGSYGTSFVAPTIHDAQNFNSQSNISGAGTPANPIILFNSTLPFNGGAGIAGTWVSTAASCAAGHGTVVNSSGSTVAATDPSAAGCKIAFGATNGSTTSAAFSVAGANGSLNPATGRSWSGGFDLDFSRAFGILPGLVVSATYWDINYRGLITNQQTQNNIPQLTTFAPIGGWTPTSAAVQQFIAGRPLTIAMPSQIWATVDGRLQNAFNIWENGIDFSVHYDFRTDNLGAFRLGLDGEELLRYSTQGGNTGRILDTKNGKNSPRYNSAELTYRAFVGWSMNGLSTQLSMNYIHPTNITASNFPYNLAGPDRGFLQGSPATFVSAGTAHLGAVINFDLSVNYNLPSGFFSLPGSVTDGTSVSVIVQNLADTAPPFNPTTANGYSIGNPIGRMVTFGLRKKF
jgi:iron complex outermembrane receptor protein